LVYLSSLYFEVNNLSHVDVYSFFLSFQNPYIEMAHTYSTGKVADLEAFVNANADKFESVGSFSYSSFI
jgi:hypothetical protein